MSQTEQPARPKTDEPSGTSFVAHDAPWLRTFRRRRRRIRILAVLGGLLGAAVLFTGVVVAVLHGEVLPGVSVAGVDVGGLGPEDARERLAAVEEARRSDRIEFVHGDRGFGLRPGPETYTAELDATVDIAMSEGRDGGPFETVWASLASVFGRDVQSELVDDVDHDRIRAWVDEVANAVDRDPSPGHVTADPETLEVTAEMPRDGETVRRAEMTRATAAAIVTDGPAELTLPVEVVPAQVPDAAVREVADQARRALEGPLTLRTSHGANVVLNPDEIARLITSRPQDRDDGKTLVLHVPVDMAEAVFEPYVERLNVAPRSATYELISGLARFDDKGDTAWTPQPAELQAVPGSEGARFDPTVTANQLSGLLREGARSAEMDLLPVAPHITTEDVQSYTVNQLIGTFTTYHACCQPRVTNIQRMADIVRGSVVKPGEVFSVNDTVGRRTRAKGFVADGTIVNGEFVDEVGGGVSQFATTAYNAAFFAGLDIVEWKTHSYYISRYPMGREATLYYPSVDLKFRNTTDNAIYVHTSYTGESITVSLFGNNGGTTVRAEHGEPHNYRSASTRRRFNPNLCSGCTRTVQSSDTGFDVVVYRVMNGERERIFTRYEAQPRIVEYGPSD